ncbi:MAG: winged helix-turn-helix transcriptional regulator [Desulfurococcales archaeon]|nr:winged helix-turn-helix transcriptional regulator [Desulfurococcales archaeon]
MTYKASLSQSLKSLMKCKQVPDADLAARLVEILLKLDRGATMKELSENLGISYPMVLKVVNELESLGIVETAKVKPQGGRGRAKKLVTLSVPMLANLVEQCKDILSVVEEEVTKRLKAAGTI